ncbi:MAG TPA: hypothetical protein VIJ24_06045, partial [Verrucomicrobiae bacterium]
LRWREFINLVEHGFCCGDCQIKLRIGQAVKFFETGTNAFAKQALPPMPQFRFHHDAAVAVVAYLRSLKKN